MEREVMDMIDPDAQHLPTWYVFDFFSNGSVYEIKCRKKKYHNWFISLKKILAAQSYESIGLPAYLVVRLNDTGEVFKLRPTQTPYDIIFSGTEKRNDPNDMEPLAVFNWNDMALLQSPSQQDKASWSEHPCGRRDDERPQAHPWR